MSLIYTYKMATFQNTDNYFLNKSTYINLRWIAIIGQFLTINSVSFLFKFEFNFLNSNFIVCLGAISNIYLIYKFKNPQLSNKNSFFY